MYRSKVFLFLHTNVVSFIGKKVNLGGACMVHETPCMRSLQVHDDFLKKRSLVWTRDC